MERTLAGSGAPTNSVRYQFAAARDPRPTTRDPRPTTRDSLYRFAETHVFLLNISYAVYSGLPNDDARQSTNAARNGSQMATIAPNGVVSRALEPETPNSSF